MLTTDDIRDTGRMPTCTYTVRRGATNGEIVQYARVGDKVYHTWQCDSDSHRILVKNCYVDDGQGNKFETVDDKGCAIDPVIMADLKYDTQGMARSWVESHVFKYADRATLHFQCTVQICNRGDTNCDAISPPKCGSRRRLSPSRTAAASTALLTTTKRPVDFHHFIPPHLNPTQEKTLSRQETRNNNKQNKRAGFLNRDSVRSGGIGSENHEGLNGSVYLTASDPAESDSRQFVIGRRSRRSVHVINSLGPSTELPPFESDEIDLFSNSIAVMDLDENVGEFGSDGYQFDNEFFEQSNINIGEEAVPIEQGICMSPLGFGMLISIVLIVIIIVFLIACYVCYSRRSPFHKTF